MHLTSKRRAVKNKKIWQIPSIKQKNKIKMHRSKRKLDQ